AGVTSVQLGAAPATSLFDELTPTGLVMLRLVFGALILGLLFRPRVRDRSSRELQLALAFGLTLLTMNFSFYQAIDRIPLGIAVTLEFVGPLGIALLGSRRGTDLLWVMLAAAGVLLLAPEIGDNGLDPDGVAFALGAGVLWAAYITLMIHIDRSYSV